MILASLDYLEKLKESGPRKKDIEFWGLSRREDQNGHNYNMYAVWIETITRYLKKRSERKIKNK